MNMFLPSQKDSFPISCYSKLLFPRITSHLNSHILHPTLSNLDLVFVMLFPLYTNTEGEVYVYWDGKWQGTRNHDVAYPKS